MPGYDDPRYLQQVIEKLQKEVAELKRSTLPLALNHRGPVTGWLRAGQVGPGPATRSAMHINLEGNQPGIAPRLTVTDANGVLRAEIGNLAANGISPAMFGIRALDASGTPIFDSEGLISVMSQLGRGDGNGTFSSTTPTLITGTSSTFVLSRAIRVRVDMGVTAFCTTTTGIVDVFVDGTDVGTTPLVGSSGQCQFGANGPTVSSSTFYSAVLSIGSHTIEPRAYVTGAGGTLHVLGSTTIVYGLGS